ncbi:sodium ion-translocating decarboxylase subunit beta, partial [Salmonella enterica subsp. enterica serovar Infantis]
MLFIVPPFLFALTSETELKIRIVHLRTVSMRENIIFPVVLFLLLGLLLPVAAE